jgi:hypothetical protein
MITVKNMVYLMIVPVITALVCWAIWALLV